MGSRSISGLTTKEIRGVFVIECESFRISLHSHQKQFMHISLESSWCWLSYPHKKIWWDENLIFQWQLSMTDFAYHDQHLEDELSAATSASSSSKTLWGRWGCRRRSPWAPFRGQFRNIIKINCLIFLLFFKNFFVDFLFFFQRPLRLHLLQKHFVGVDKWQCRRHLFWGNFEKKKFVFLK